MDIVLACIGLGFAVVLLIYVCVPRNESRIVQASKPVHLPKPKRYLDITDLEEEDIANLERQAKMFKDRK